MGSLNAEVSLGDNDENVLEYTTMWNSLIINKLVVYLNE